MKDVKLVTVEVAEIKPSQKERHYTNADADTDTDTDTNAEAVSESPRPAQWPLPRPRKLYFHSARNL